MDETEIEWGFLIQIKCLNKELVPRILQEKCSQVNLGLIVLFIFLLCWT